ncbi:VTT domain-containing protein [Candidatus Saccharibacteria bacterium]|nr:VTT domain-containing protein [Candidatus Saccharibacteria bacterium]
MIAIDKFILGGGLVMIGATVFAESGLLIGFFLPGDTLLFGAGILASQGVLPLHWLIIVVVISAIVGDNVGYSIGRRTGKRLFKKKESILFKPEHLERAEKFYEQHGGKTIILARFVPIVRTFAPMVAGIGKMSRGKFLFFNIIGGILWGAGVIMLGYWLGSKMPWVEHFITPVILGIVAISFVASAFHILKEADNRQLIMQKIKLLISNIALNKRID